MRWLAVSSLLLLVSATTAHAADSADACADASEKGQLLRIKGRLGEARAQFQACIADGCPQVLRKDCSQFLAEVETAMPTVVLAARDEHGDLVDVRVTSGEKVLVDKLDGKAIAMDPGAYDLRFQAEGHLPVTQRVLVREGEKNRVVVVTLAPLAAAPPAPAPVRSSPTAAWVATGVSLAGFAAFGALGWSARSQFDDLKASCGARCAQDDVDRVKRRAVWADVGLIVGIGSAGLATWLFVDHARHTEVRAVAGLGFLGLEGSF